MALVVGFPTSGGAENGPFGFETVVERARELAATGYEEPRRNLPPPLESLNYDRYRDIRFRPDRALWHGERLFEVQFFHLGFLYREPVGIHVVEDGQTRQLSYSQDMFTFGPQAPRDPLPEALGFAGFRVHFPLHGPGYKDEVAVFLGASYFRVLGRDQHYGASVRGLAIDTAMPRGEEFPRFRDFWLMTPEPEATTLTLYALLDSPRYAGAYAFVINPGTETTIAVRAALFPRARVGKLGLAPLTSMYLFGERTARRFDDYRPAVHDSDGLLIHTGAGEWIWRPLDNPAQLQVTAFLDENPRGFGLMQRARAFDRYLDLESAYERRPSVWVEPDGDWGKGAVELVEIPSDEEVNDNIVAYWRPDAVPNADDRMDLAYTLTARLVEPVRPPLGRTVRTLIGSAAIPGSEHSPPAEMRRFVVDFEGGDLPFLSAGEPVEARLANSAGEVSEVTARKIPDTGGWRVSFRLLPKGGDTADLSLFLEHRGRRVSETWKYLWRP